MKPYYDDGRVTIYHGDSLEVLPHLAPVDLVLTDPPYNVGKAYGAHNDSMAADEYAEWCGAWATMARERCDRMLVFPGHGNLGTWYRIFPPVGIGCWHKPGNPAGGGVIQFCEWEPYLLWGKPMGGSDVVRATVNRQHDTGDHPCPKPLKLFAALLAQSKASSVIDPFMGSGTTLCAAKARGIRAVGIELEERFCEIAAHRCAQDVLDLEAA